MTEQMQAYLVIAGIALAVGAAASSGSQDSRAAFKLGSGYATKQWREFKTKFGKTYSNQAEDESRFGLFVQHLHRIAAHNANDSHFGYKLGLNQMSDWTRDELAALTSRSVEQEPGLIGRPTSGTRRLLADVGAKDEPPKYINWAQSINVVGPVKAQGQCGSCWAFATTGLLEGQQRLAKTQTVVELSVQQLIDCDRKQNQGCDGGYVTDAIGYIIQNGGLEQASSYPYISGSGRDSYQCRQNSSRSYASTQNLTKSVVVDCKTEDDLKKLIANYGPVAVYIVASLPTLESYESGVYFDPRCHGKVDHALLAVGYGTTGDGRDYWILKNSWGTQWGQAGYLWLARNRNNHCGILRIPTVVL